MPKKIIIDAFQHSSSVTGTDRMSYNFLKELQKLDTTNMYYVLCSRRPYVRSAVTAPNFKVIKPSFLSALPFLGRYFNYVWRRLSKIWLISKRADVYYSFHNMQLPGRRLAKRMIASNLDLIPILLDEYKNLGRIDFEEQMAGYQRVVGMADAFVSISNYSKRELCETLGADASKVTVIHLAADPTFLNRGETGRAPNGITKKYIFTIGGSEPRKNVQTIVAAYNKLATTIQNEYQLVIAGGQWHHKLLKELRLNDNIITLGYVSDSDLPLLYSGSSCFVFASTYEGFGFAILEAMACGTPVINATGSSLDEVAGSATLTFKPDNAKQLSNHMEELLGNKNLKKKLISAGYEQNKKFSWKSSTAKLHALLIQD